MDSFEKWWDKYVEVVKAAFPEFPPGKVLFAMYESMEELLRSVKVRAIFILLVELQPMIDRFLWLHKVDFCLDYERWPIIFFVGNGDKGVIKIEYLK